MMKRRVIGRVTSDKMTKTIRVAVPRRVKDKVTGKYLTRETVCMAHDEHEQANISDVVELVESRPLSKRKRWVLLRVVSRGQ
jgi:small subunit ribosomal protein S17